MTHEEADPVPEFSAAPEEAQEEPPRVENNSDFVVTPPSPPPSAPAPLPVVIPVPIPAPASEPQVNAELEARYNEAQAEIQRLRALLAAAPDPSSVPTEATGLRRRNRTLSDDGSTMAGTEIGTMLDEAQAQPEGVPLQVVLIIALGVFITTYLFF
jgi:vesicle-associated membrane protein-associated protein A